MSKPVVGLTIFAGYRHRHYIRRKTLEAIAKGYTRSEQLLRQHLSKLFDDSGGCVVCPWDGTNLCQSSKCTQSKNDWVAAQMKKIKDFVTPLIQDQVAGAEQCINLPGINTTVRGMHVSGVACDANFRIFERRKKPQSEPRTKQNGRQSSAV